MFQTDSEGSPHARIEQRLVRRKDIGKAGVRLEDRPQILRRRDLVQIERLDQTGLVVEGTEAGIREDDIILVAAAGLQLGEHVLIEVRGDAANRDAGRLFEALLDLRMDVVLPRHHDHRAASGLACRSAGGEETGDPADRQSGAGRPLDKGAARNSPRLGRRQSGRCHRGLDGPFGLSAMAVPPSMSSCCGTFQITKINHCANPCQASYHRLVGGCFTWNISGTSRGSALRRAPYQFAPSFDLSSSLGARSCALLPVLSWTAASAPRPISRSTAAPWPSSAAIISAVRPRSSWSLIRAP